VWDTVTGEQFSVVETAGPLTSVAFSPDREEIAVTDSGGGLLRYDQVTLDQIAQVTANAPLAEVAYTPNSDLLATAAQDNTLQFWITQTDAQNGTLIGHTGPVNGLAPSPGGTWLASASTDGTVRLWAVPELPLAPQPQPSLINTGNAATVSTLDTLSGHTGDITSLDFNEDGSLLVTASLDDSVRLWDINERQGIGNLQGARRQPFAVTFAPGGITLAVGYADGVLIWDVPTQQVVTDIPTQVTGSRVFGVDFRPDNRRLLTAEESGDVTIWFPLEGRANRVLAESENAVFQAIYSPDGEQTASIDGTTNLIRIWSVERDQPIFELSGHTEGVLDLAYNPDGSALASAGVGGTIRLWDTSSGAERRVYEGHEDRVFAVAFSPDGSVLASVSADGTLRLWNVEQATELALLEIGDSQDEPISLRDVAFSPDGRLIAVGAADNQVWLFGLQ
jgi:WD40 repeat protein